MKNNIFYKGDYVSSLSDLLVKIVKVQYQCDEYFKAKIMLFNKNNGIFYETINVKLYKEKIGHWRKIA